ncbi:envelope integrity protein Cei [Candidatus Mycobacterium wuenschmannii]|uniref:Envelope integrity protein Cei n=1 Tax=Candidatus Mycobacterium wuenschmannii TaxID=3027808 RepID=A0ABY8W0B3_9MYCO|nr:envelope integrity protein Cei [Candidatus Mycobacterium wuenschmannii]WIM88439.1 envelope integrity protein Cei [Candidatus Mycobacterium wuenschmannii]
MVAHITEGTAFDKHGRPFRRRNARPAIALLVVLLVASAVVWTIALTRPTEVHEATVCNAPPEQADPALPHLGSAVSRSTMINVAPAKLADAKVRVLNASGRGGQAADVAGALKDLGFAQPTAANDPVYAKTRLNCQGQIRFGEAGQAGAAAVWLVAPCAELYRDDRTDDSVDLAIGTEFSALAHSDDIASVLAGLKRGDSEAADSALLTKIHAGTC